MKELSIEEKAQRYDEAIERIQKYSKDEYGCTRLRSEDIFPELKESEDERIRKALVNTFKFYDSPMNSPYLVDISKKDILAWLEKQKIEKQGEQKPAEKVEPKFKVGDTIKHLNGNVFHIARIDGTLYISDEGATISFGRENDWELIEQKPAWSEEDDIRLNATVSFLERYKGIDYENTGVCISWLKSLRPQNRWKPSKEQIESLEYSLGDYNIKIFEDRYEILKSLYNDLKKLKEE